MMHIPDNNSVYARGNSPDSYASGYPPLMNYGVPPAYEFRQPQITPPSIQNYETFIPPHMVSFLWMKFWNFTIFNIMNNFY